MATTKNLYRESDTTRESSNDTNTMAWSSLGYGCLIWLLELLIRYKLVYNISKQVQSYNAIIAERKEDLDYRGQAAISRGFPRTEQTRSKAGLSTCLTYLCPLYPS
jgi:hypothetical protein